MSSKYNNYHINPETKTVGICRAVKQGCRFGGDSDHFMSRASAESWLVKTDPELKKLADNVYKTYSKEQRVTTQVSPAYLTTDIPAGYSPLDSLGDLASKNPVASIATIAIAPEFAAGAAGGALIGALVFKLYENPPRFMRKFLQTKAREKFTKVRDRATEARRELYEKLKDRGIDMAYMVSQGYLMVHGGNWRRVTTEDLLRDTGDEAAAKVIAEHEEDWKLAEAAKAGDKKALAAIEAKLEARKARQDMIYNTNREKEKAEFAEMLQIERERESLN